MKKKLRKKLALNKSTIAKLDPQDKIKIKSGITAFAVTCDCYTEHKSCTLGGNCCPPAEKLDNPTIYNC